MPLNPHVKGGGDVPVTDGGTGASDAASGLSNLGGLDTGSHDARNHAGVPGVGDLTTLAHNALNHAGITGVPGNMQSDLTFLASGTSINSGALGFTPVLAIMVLTDLTNASAVHGVALIRGTGSNQLALYFNAFNGGGTVTQNNAGGNWSCTQFNSAGVIVSGTNTYSVGLLVLGQ